MKIGEFFVKNNYVTQEAMNEALELQKSNEDQYIGEIIVKMNVITREQLIKYICPSQKLIRYYFSPKLSIGGDNFISFGFSEMNFTDIEQVWRENNQLTNEKTMAIKSPM